MYPVAQQLGINLVHFGVLSTVNLAIGQVTPPVGVNLFVAIGVACMIGGKWMDRFRDFCSAPKK